MEAKKQARTRKTKTLVGKPQASGAAPTPAGPVAPIAPVPVPTVTGETIREMFLGGAFERLRNGTCTLMEQIWFERMAQLMEESNKDIKVFMRRVGISETEAAEIGSQLKSMM